MILSTTVLDPVVASSLSNWLDGLAAAVDIDVAATDSAAGDFCSELILSIGVALDAVVTSSLANWLWLHGATVVNVDVFFEPVLFVELSPSRAV